MREESMRNRMERREKEDLFGYQKTGEQILAAMEEIAKELGGEDFAKIVLIIATKDFPLPSADSLELLEIVSPGSAAMVMTRAREIQHDQINSERKQLKKETKSEIARQVLQNFWISKG